MVIVMIWAHNIRLVNAGKDKVINDISGLVLGEEDCMELSETFD